MMPFNRSNAGASVGAGARGAKRWAVGACAFGLLALGSTAARADPTVRHVETGVGVNPVANNFTVRNRWEVSGMTRSQLMQARGGITFSGKNGVMRAPLVVTSTPEQQQRTGHGVRADGVRPVGLPSAVGSRASTTSTPGGLTAMQHGPIGNGASTVTIGQTHYRDGIPVTEVTERGTYSLATMRAPAVLAPVAAMYNLAASTPPGRLALGMAHYVMGRLHNYVFDPASALAGAAGVAPIQRTTGTR